MWKRRTPNIFLSQIFVNKQPQIPGFWTGIRLGTGTSLGGWWGQPRWSLLILHSCFSDDLGILELTNFTLHKCFHDIRCSIPYISWKPNRFGSFRWLVFHGRGSIVFLRFEAKSAVRRGKTKQLREGWAFDLLGSSLGNEFDLCKVSRWSFFVARSKLWCCCGGRVVRSAQGFQTISIQKRVTQPLKPLLLCCRMAGQVQSAWF